MSDNGKTMRFLVCSSKGGVGKSFVARHFLPFAYAPLGYVDTDLSNRGAKMLEKSKRVKIAYRGSVESLPEHPEVLLDFDHLVIDVGGKDKEVEATLDALGKMLFTDFLDLVLIPLQGGEEEVRNALETLLLVRKKGYGGKVAIVLNRWGERKPEEQFARYLKVRNHFLEQGEVVEIAVPKISTAVVVAERRNLSVSDLEEELDGASLREQIKALWEEGLRAPLEKRREYAERIRELQRKLSFAEEIALMRRFAEAAEKTFGGTKMPSPFELFGGGS